MAMAVSAADLRVGMIVIGSDGARVGRVKTVSEAVLQVEGQASSDLLVPFETIEAVVSKQVVMLDVPAAQVSHQERPSR